MDGIVNVNKPLGITSHDVVYRLRRILGIKKIGHTGTLDPDASGVLPMCVGKGTKLAEYLTAKDKQYFATMKLGSFTDTQDASGKIIESFEVSVTKEEIRDAVKGFVGDIMQIPPMYSAIKVDGKKLYELAREGKTVEREPRQVTIENIEIKNIDMETNTVEMLVDCSKGTYIRTLCNDIGAALGCGGHMASLKRTKSGRFDIKDSFTLEEIEKMAGENDFSFMVSVGEALSEYEKIVLADRNAQRVRNGIKISVEGLKMDEIYRVFDEQEEFLALAQQTENGFTIIKSFYGGA
ncbi:MAG: tRNA pseudouridine(55) synthase TruB [Clostridia bacterium]|nr:tRNA pseudouridine(55) synthase TruB [Clostridia bacterium]